MNKFDLENTQQRNRCFLIYCNLILPHKSYQEIQRDDVTITYEATVGKINDDTLFYLMSRGIPKNEALALVVMGFFDEFTRELPMEYAVELNKLIEMEMEGSVS